MTNSELIDAVAKLIEPQLFQLPPENQTAPYQRFVAGTKERARAIIALIEQARADA